MPDFLPVVLLVIDLGLGEPLHRLQVGEVALGVPVGGVAILQIGARSALRDSRIVGQVLGPSRSGLADTDVVYVARLHVCRWSASAGRKLRSVSLYWEAPDVCVPHPTMLVVS